MNLVERPAARYGFVSGVVGKHWYISHGECASTVQFGCYLTCIMYYVCHDSSLSLLTQFHQGGTKLVYLMIHGLSVFMMNTGYP